MHHVNSVKSYKKMDDFCQEYESGLNAGHMNLTKSKNRFYSRFNREMLFLCKSLPQSAQTESLLFLMKSTGLTLVETFDFFKHYKAPAWSIIFWLTKIGPENEHLTGEDIENAVRAHAMAMFLHSFDDHLNDGQTLVSHLALLLRSQAWIIMNDAIKRLAKGLVDGDKTAGGFMDTYYTAILDKKNATSLDNYCHRFKNQMGTGFIVPVIMAKKMGLDEDTIHAIQTAFGAFGIAWRLMDDVEDISDDLNRGAMSSVYMCLPKPLKKKWVEHTDHQALIMDYIFNTGIIEKIKVKMIHTLEKAVQYAELGRMPGLANEFQGMLNRV